MTTDDNLIFDDLDDEEPEQPGPFRDGVVHVLSRKCSTCIFRPGNLMHLRPGAVDKMVSECQEENTVIPCHDTLFDGDGKAVCRGFYDLHRQDTMPLRLAMGFGIVRFTDPPEKESGE